LVEVGKIRETAVLNLALVIPVLNLAACMVVAGLVEGGNLAEVIADGGDVVSYNVHHHPNAFCVGSSNEVFKFLGRTEVRIDGIPVPGPVTVVASVGVVNDGTDPDGVKTHTLNVRETVFYAVEGTSAVVAQTSASGST